MSNDSEALMRLAELLDSCEPEDDQPITWGAMRRQVRAAAEGGTR